MYIRASCFICLAFLWTTGLALRMVQPTPPCPCVGITGRKAHCNPVDDWSDGKKETLVITNRDSDYKMWMWDSLTAVIEWNDDLNSTLTDELMCYAHSKGKKYGFYVKQFPTPDHATDVSAEISYKRADLVAVNLIDYLHNCDYAAAHAQEIANYTTTVLSEIKKHITAKVLCVMPWKPPCYELNCDVGPALAKQCDGVIFSPESYNTYCSETCTAKATVPFSKITIGITEYLAAGFNSSQLLLGIPWHGYNYTCRNDDKVDKWSGHYVCHLGKKLDSATNKTVCDIEGSREKKLIGSVVGKVPQMALLDATFSKPDQTPYKVQNGSGNDTRKYMLWFEDIGSLLAKYDAVQKYDIKGCVIYTGDDLAYDHVKVNEEFDNHMWSWMLHSILSSGQTYEKESKGNIAGTVAGVGVGMFLLGCLLGTLISCIIFRRKKALHAPFKHDTLADEYTDDLDHNQL
ncbi:di-N-acetylchitobiase-like [Mercenaria mercenaria]|uniref:di-N-acetylchitobiase-like n=1 Tax=Mercenaria mercenaria TaxID=6596 RepID=UPI00234F9D03|nr:di-N-acetylchitobiase-like [Mercenaria mercenaria]